jgi:hypothetical protein
MTDKQPGSKPKKFRFKAKHADSDRILRSRRKKRNHDPAEAEHSNPGNERLLGGYSKNHSLNGNDVFRESLFDALADEDGAAFWENVYGQPIHVYPRAPGISDEAYTAYVRAMMYSRTHQNLIEERDRIANARRKLREEMEQKEERVEQDVAFDKEVEESLQRGKNRKILQEKKKAWNRYVDAWENMGPGPGFDQGKLATELIPWPNGSLDVSRVSYDEVSRFFEDAATLEESDSQTRLREILKIERIRWHPDKMRQRLGHTVMDERTTRSVTGVFQIVDRIWTESR